MHEPPLLRPYDEALRLEVHPELDGRVLVRWLTFDSRKALHGRDWREYPHCSTEEAEDVIAAVTSLWMEAPEL